MEVVVNRSFFLIFLLITINETSSSDVKTKTTEFKSSPTEFKSSTPDPWSPVITKTKNSTRDWKVTTKGLTSLTDPDSLATASIQYDLIPSANLHHVSAPPPELADHTEHYEHQAVHPHYHHEHHHEHPHDPHNHPHDPHDHPHELHDHHHDPHDHPHGPHGHHHDPHERPHDSYYEVPSPHEIISNTAPRYDPVADADGAYYYPSYAPSPQVPPYGPPPGPSPYPDDSVQIELSQDRLIVRCVVHEPLEHIVWTRFPCPNEYFYGTGVQVAAGSVVYNMDLYDVRIVGEHGDIASELLMRAPLDPSSSGLYICEAWPHYKKPADMYGHYPSPAYPSLSDAFIIGGSELIDQCYFNNKQGFLHKQFPFRNRNDVDRTDSGAKKRKPKPQSSQASFANAMRKPRNNTNSNSRMQLSMKGFPNSTTTNKPEIDDGYNYPKPVLTDPQLDQRYNFKFDNETELLNASATDVFSKFDSLTSNNALQFQTQLKNHSFNKRLRNSIRRPKYNNGTFNFLINRVKYANKTFDSKYSVVNDKQNNTAWNWTLSTNVKNNNNSFLEQNNQV